MVTSEMIFSYQGMLHAAILRSPHAHAKIKNINIDEALKAPGVVAIYTGKDLEGKIGENTFVMACARS